MTLELTEKQRQAINDHAGLQPVELIDPASSRVFVLLAREQYERIRCLLEEPSEPSPQAAEWVRGVTPEMLRAQKAFWRDLPELLSQRKLRGQWVGYHGEERIGFEKTSTALMRRCLQLGLPRGEFYIGRIDERLTPPWEPGPLEQTLYEVIEGPTSCSSTPAS